jgi:hypothetical protein
MLLNNLEKAGQQKWYSIHPNPFMFAKLSIRDFDIFLPFSFAVVAGLKPQTLGCKMSAQLQH